MDYLTNKQNQLNDKYNELNKMKYIMNNTPTPTDWIDEKCLDELLERIDYIYEDIQQLKTFLDVAKNTQMYKSELLKKSVK